MLLDCVCVCVWLAYKWFTVIQESTFSTQVRLLYSIFPLEVIVQKHVLFAVQPKQIQRFTWFTTRIELNSNVKTDTLDSIRLQSMLLSTHKIMWTAVLHLALENEKCDF